MSLRVTSLNVCSSSIRSPSSMSYYSIPTPPDACSVKSRDTYYSVYSESQRSASPAPSVRQISRRVSLKDDVSHSVNPDNQLRTRRNFSAQSASEKSRKPLSSASERSTASSFPPPLQLSRFTSIKHSSPGVAATERLPQLSADKMGRRAVAYSIIAMTTSSNTSRSTPQQTSTHQPISPQTFPKNEKIFTTTAFSQPPASTATVSTTATGGALPTYTFRVLLLK